MGNDCDAAVEPEAPGEAFGPCLPPSGPPLWEPALFAHATLAAPAALNCLFPMATGEPWLQTPLLSLPPAGPEGTEPAASAGSPGEADGESPQGPPAELPQLVTYQWTDVPSHLSSVGVIAAGTVPASASSYFATATGFVQAGNDPAPWQAPQLGHTFAPFGQCPLLGPPPFVTLPGHHEGAELQWAAGLPGQVPVLPAPHLPPVPASCSVLPPLVAPPAAPPEDPQHGCTATPPPPPSEPPAAPPGAAAQAAPPPSEPPRELPPPQEDAMPPPSAPPNLPEDLQVEPESASGHDTAAPAAAPPKVAPLEAVDLDAYEHEWFPPAGSAPQQADTEPTTACHSQEPPHSAGQNPPPQAPPPQMVQAFPGPPPMASPKLPKDLTEALQRFSDPPPAPGESPS